MMILIYAIGIAVVAFIIVLTFAVLKIASDEDERKERQEREEMELKRLTLEHRLQMQAERGLQERGNEVTSEDIDTPRRDS